MIRVIRKSNRKLLVGTIAVAAGALVVGTVIATRTPAQTPFVDRIVDAPSLEAAIASALPLLGDGLDNDGMWLLARYASAHALQLTRLETTTVADVVSNPQDERGKQLCVAGELRSIERVESTGVVMYRGHVHSQVGSAWFITKTSPGAELATVNLCGVVTGRHGDAAVVVGELR